MAKGTKGRRGRTREERGNDSRRAECAGSSLGGAENKSDTPHDRSEGEGENKRSDVRAKLCERSLRS